VPRRAQAPATFSLAKTIDHIACAETPGASLQLKQKQEVHERRRTWDALDLVEDMQGLPCPHSLGVEKQGLIPGKQG